MVQELLGAVFNPHKCILLPLWQRGDTPPVFSQHPCWRQHREVRGGGLTVSSRQPYIHDAKLCKLVSYIPNFLSCTMQQSPNHRLLLLLLLLCESLPFPKSWHYRAGQRIRVRIQRERSKERERGKCCISMNTIRTASKFQLCATAFKKRKKRAILCVYVSVLV